jgi:hypothetical protein
MNPHAKNALRAALVLSTLALGHRAALAEADLDLTQGIITITDNDGEANDIDVRPGFKGTLELRESAVGFRLTPGTDPIFFDGELAVFDLSSVDTVRIVSADFGDTVHVTDQPTGSGSGSGFVTIVDVSTGGGNDDVFVGPATITSLFIDAGSEADDIVLDDLVIFEDLDVTGGPGNDRFEVGSVNSSPGGLIDGDVGNDEVEVNAITTWFDSFQFVNMENMFLPAGGGVIGEGLIQGTSFRLFSGSTLHPRPTDPGAGPGSGTITLDTSTAHFDATSTVIIDTAGGLDSTGGTLALGGSALVVMDDESGGGGVRTIINRAGTLPVFGTFAGLPEGAPVPGTDYFISYFGGDGNDVVLFMPQIGACCFNDSTCQNLSLDDCVGLGGLYQGDDSFCDPTACDDPVSPARAGATDKGSLLAFSKVEIRLDAAGNLRQDTFLSITNDYPADVDVQMYFINGDAPWTFANNRITLTANEPTYWSAFTGQPKGVSPFGVLGPPVPANDGTGELVLRGWVVAWAVNAAGDEIRWNHLSGAGTVVNYFLNHAWEYGATSFPAVDDAVAHGGVTGSPGELRMDGNEYALLPSFLLLNFQAAGSDGFSNPGAGFTVISDTDLTLHPMDLDVRQNTTGPVTTKASIDIWNENEHKFSGTHRCVTCWDQTRISQYGPPNSFLRVFLQTDHGKARIDGHRADACEPFPLISRPAALLGVHARLLRLNAADPFFGLASGGNLHGLGLQTALIRYDVGSGPPEGTAGRLAPGR